MNLLVVDIGNTRLKWGWLDTNGLLVGDPVVYRQADLEDVLDALWVFSGAPEKVIIANVARDIIRDQISGWLWSKWKIKPELLVSPTRWGFLRHAYAVPEHLGCDRWAAMIEAFHSVKSAVCVVDCGSAITIDMVDAHGQHLGGFILPGFSAMQLALQENTSLHPGELTVSLPFQPAHSTQAAITGGIAFAVESLVTKTLNWLEQATGQTAQCYITGGDANMLSRLLQHEHISDPDLVIKGLVRIAGGN